MIVCESGKRKKKLPVKAEQTRIIYCKIILKILIPLNAVMNNAGIFPHHCVLPRFY